MISIIMKKFLAFLLIIACSFYVNAQTTTYSYSGASYACSNYSSGSGIALVSSQPSNNVFNFRIAKREGGTCSDGPNGSFLNNVNWTLYQTGVSVGTGTTMGSGSSTGYSTQIQITMPSSFTSGTRTYYAVMVSGGITFTTGNITISASTPSLSIVNNVSFGTNTLYSGVNYTGTFSVRNTGSGNWSGSMYVVLGHGGTLSATGSSTINAGSTQSYSVSYTPNTTQSNTSASASYQTNGQGSGVTVPGQSPPSLSIIGNLAITGNAASPSSGTQNVTNFTFGATLSNVAPSPTATVDIEFISPDGVTTSITNITRSGNNYSHTRTLQQVGTYQYRYIAYQGTRPNVATGWQNITVTASTPSLSIVNNVSFGTNTLYSGVNYTGTFSVRNTGSGNWSGSMYVVLGHGGTLSATGSSTINAGSTQSYSVSYTPNTTQSNTSASASYQTNGQGSGVTVPGQSPPSLSIIGNLAITGNAASPSSGTQNVTNFTFGATLSNVAPLPTLAPTVDIEFLAPDGLTYTTTNIPNTSGNIFSKTQTLQQAGTYQYRYITYQITRPNAATAWQSVIVSSNQSVTVTSPAANSTYQTGASLPIAWAFSGYTGNVSIELTQGATGTTAFRVIADGTANDNSESWTIPNDIPTGPYRVKVYNTGAGTGGNPTIVNYSGVFNIGTGSTCPTCPNFNLTVSSFPLTGQEGLCAAQYLCNSKIIQPNQPNPTNLILREDVAKIALLSGLADGDIVTVSGGGGSFPADFFPTTFIDLFQGTTGSYHRYAKILSYFQGADQTTPFDRYKPFPNNDVVRPYFNPTDPISRIDLLKVYLETWNIDEENNGNIALYFNDISDLTSAQLNYLKKAVQLGLVVNGTSTNSIAFRPFDKNNVSGTATREEAFLILYRLRALANPAKPDFTLNTNYYQPANQSIGNLSIYKGLTQGNFSHHTSTDFGINDIGFSLNFAHSYQSFMTMLPDEFKLVQPLGYGWTHPYNVYLFTTVQINDANGAVAAKPLLVLAWGDGTMDVYDNTNINSPTPISLGTNYNILTRVNSTSYTIKTKSQHVYTFNQQGSEAGLYRLTNIKDRYNNTLTIAYKAGASMPPVSQVIDYVQAPSGRRINFTYDTQNRITNVNFPGSSTNTRNLTFAYTNKNLTSFKDAKGQSTGKTTTYTYGTGSEIYLLKQIAFPRGNKIENVYDPNSRLQWTQARDANNNITAKTDLTGGFGNFNSDGSFTNNWTQDCSCPNSQSAAKYDKNGITTEFQNKVIKVLSPASANHPSMPSAVTYSSLNGSNPQTYTPTYDSNGNVLSISRPDGKSESFTYDAYHNRRTHTDAKSITTTYNWSADGKFLNSIVRPIGDGNNLTQSFVYQTNGLMSSSTNNENIVTNFGYDARGNMNSIQIPVLSLSSSAVYDFASRMTSNTNARNKTTTYLFDDNDNLTRETDPSNRQTNYDYDENDNLKSITNAKNEVTTLGYDGFDRLISETFGGKTKSYVYDNGQNRLTEFRKAGYANNNAKRFSYTYDANNRLYGNGYITEIGYDPLNRMSSIKGGTQATHQLSNFSYDALNRLTGYTDAWNNTVGYGYDDNGNETRIDYPNGNKLYKTYDNLNRLKTVSWNTILVATYNYVGSRLDNVVYGNNVKTQYSYDNAGRPTGISTKTNNGTGSTLYAATFTLDNLGNHTEENETQPFATLPVPTAGTTSSTFTNNRINNLGSTNFTHDDDGNITAKGSSTYGYDLEDNLTSYTGSGLTMTALYDAFGNRRSVTRNGTETRYLLDINGLASILAETNSSNTVQNYYLHGLGLVARVKADGTTIQYYHGDFRGSTIAMTNASQTITHKYQYDEFGNLTNSQEADPNPFRYVGAYGIMHESPDLTYMRARYYDPTTGRFNSEDPIWSTNLYPYSGNNSINNVDITGNQFVAAASIFSLGYTIGVLTFKDVAYNYTSNKPIARGMLDHYLNGNGKPKQLRKSTFDEIVNYVRTTKGITKEYIAQNWVYWDNYKFTSQKDGRKIYSVNFSFSRKENPNLWAAFGRIQLYFSETGEIIGIDDNYNFDSDTSDGFINFLANEYGTLGKYYGGTSFFAFYYLF